MKEGVRFLTILLLYCAIPYKIHAQYSNIPMHKIDLIFAGDAMQHETQIKMAKGKDGKYSYSSYYRHISAEIKKADIAVINLETPIGTDNFSGYPSFCAPDSFLYAISDAGFNVMLLANNHIIDRGKNGALYTINLIDSIGKSYCGVYRNKEERDSLHPLIIEKEGVKTALLNYTYSTNGRAIPAPLVVNLIDKDVISKDIEKAKKLKADVIIACMHWGDEYLNTPPKRIKEMADWLLEQGVDHIIGHHPHVIQPVEIRKDTISADKHTVAYSLGNVVSNMHRRYADGGIMLRMRLRRILNCTRLASLQYLLTWIAPLNSNGTRDYTILPAATTEFKDNAHATFRLKQFLEDTRTLFRNHNRGNVKEFFLDSVRITR